MKNMSLRALCLGIFVLSQYFLAGQITTPELRFSIRDAPADTALLVYRRGESVRMQDTVVLRNGAGVYRPADTIPTGIYLLVFPPTNNGFEFLVDQSDQRQHLSGTLNDPVDYVRSDSPNNRLFDAYRRGMSRRIARRQTLLQRQADPQDSTGVTAELRALTAGVRLFQDSVIRTAPGSFAAKLVASFVEPVVPPAPVRPDGTVDSLFRYRYYHDHVLDGIDFTEPGFLRTPYFQPAIDRYLDQLTPRHPDSLILAVDYLLARAAPNALVHRYLLGNFIDRYYRPKVIGLDAVFVHLADRYLRTGAADDWINADTKATLLRDADMLRNVLIGRTAPDVEVQLFDTVTREFSSETVSPHDMTARYTVVFLWKPGCGACKKMTDALKPVYRKYDRTDLEVFSISSADYRNLDKAKQDIEAKRMPWIITADPYLRARALRQYYGTQLPKLYLLDEDKKIIYSRINAEQLDQILEKELGRAE